MKLSAPWDGSLDIIDLQAVKKWMEINQMGLSYPWSNSIDIIAFQKAKINW